MIEITLAAILRDEEKLLPHFLKHHQELFPEIVLVDTGSKDKSVDIIKSFGLKVHFFEWQDDFAAARNYAISRATKDYILVLDIDEKIEKKDFHELQQIVSKTKKRAYWLQLINFSNDYQSLNWQPLDDKFSAYRNIASGYERYPLIRLFKNDRQTKFRGIIHEYIAIDNYQTESELLNIPILHFGWVTSELKSKSDKYFQLIRKNWEQEQTPQSALYYLHIIRDPLQRLQTAWQISKKYPQYFQFYEIMAQSAAELKQWKRAISYLSKAIKLSGETITLLAQLVNCYLEAGRYQEAIAVAEKIPENIAHPHIDLQRLKIAILQKNSGIVEQLLQRLQKYLPQKEFEFLTRLTKDIDKQS